MVFRFYAGHVEPFFVCRETILEVRNEQTRGLRTSLPVYIGTLVDITSKVLYHDVRYFVSFFFFFGREIALSR